MVAQLPPGLRGRIDDAQLALLQQYTAYLRNGPVHHSADTITTYISHLGTFVRYLPGDSPIVWVDVVSKAGLNLALMNIPAEQAATRRNMYFAVKAFARFLVDVDLLPEERLQAIATIKLRTRHQPARPFLSDEQVDQGLRKLLAHPGYEAAERLTNLAIFAMLTRTGLRSSELTNLRLADLDFERGVITVVRGKGGKTRLVGLPAKVAPLLRLYIANRPATACERLMVSPRGTPMNRDAMGKRFQRISRITGIQVSPHRLRRTFATSVAHRGVPLDKLQSVLGHADIQTTRMYVQTMNPAVALEMVDW